ncbi:MAG: methylase, partial [Candidatus Omnitrophica bacterium]|nr:methylase [Candidatus Omnitrophota bacterium]
MKITLIKPNIGRLSHSLYVDEGRMEPLQLGVIAALTPPDVEVVLFDDRMEDINYDDPTDLAAITVETYTARRAYEIAAEYRRRG